MGFKPAPTGRLFPPVPLGRKVPFVEYDEVGAVCSDCGRLFGSEETLAAHRADVHPRPVEARPAQSRVSCSVCGRRLRSVGALSEHNRRAHTG